MKKILVLTLILNLGFCSGLPSNANANGDRHQLRMSFSDVLECPAQSLETRTSSNNTNIGTMSGGTVNSGTVNNGTVNVVNNYGTVAPYVKTADTPPQGKK